MKIVNPSAIELNKMRMFVFAAQHKSFKAVSEIMMVSPSVVGKNIAVLEKTLGVQLFFRKNNRLEITPAGEYLAKEWIPLLDLLYSSMEQTRALQQEDGMQLTFGIWSELDDTILLEMIKKFKQYFSKVNIILESYDVKTLSQGIMHHTFDLIFTPFLPPSTIDDTEIGRKKICTSKTVAYIYESNPLYNKQSLKKEDLYDQPLIICKDRHFYDHKPDYYDILFQDWDKEPCIKHVANNKDAAIAYTKLEEGILIYMDILKKLLPCSIKTFELPVQFSDDLLDQFLYYRIHDRNRWIDQLLQFIPKN